MSFKHLLTQISDDGILTIAINRETKLNALCSELISELADLLAAHRHDTTIKGIILTGTGAKAFAAGADISEFTGMDASAGEKLSLSGQAVFRQLETYPKPIIAAVNGFALGGGCELAMACHLRIASENAKFGQPEVNLGLIPGYGGTQRLLQLVGKGKGLELLMTGDMIDAHEALRLGLVNYVVTADQLITTCTALLKKIASKAPIAIAKVITAVDAYYTPCVDGFAVEAEAFGQCCSTQDFEEGTAAFLEKRKPVFIGK